MDKHQGQAEILLKATGQGYSIIIHGKRGDDGSWKCAIEENEVTLTDIPKSEHVATLGEKRDYKKTDFEYSFEETMNKIGYTDWFLCHPEKLHADITHLVIQEFEKRMADFNSEFPPEGPMEEFLRESRAKEWKARAGDAVYSLPNARG